MITRVQHVAIEVDDLAAAVGFYEALGLARAPRPDALGANGAWLDAGGVQLHLVEVAEVPSCASNHVAFGVTDCAAEVARLRAAGFEVSDPFDVGAGIQTFLRDPAGNLVELNQPTA